MPGRGRSSGPPGGPGALRQLAAASARAAGGPPSAGRTGWPGCRGTGPRASPPAGPWPPGARVPTGGAALERVGQARQLVLQVGREGRRQLADRRSRRSPGGAPGWARRGRLPRTSSRSCLIIEPIRITLPGCLHRLGVARLLVGHDARARGRRVVGGVGLARRTWPAKLPDDGATAPHPASERHEHLVLGERAVAADELVRAGVVGVVEGHVALGGEQHVAEPARGGVGDDRAVPALGDGVCRGCAPRRDRRGARVAASASAASDRSGRGASGTGPRRTGRATWVSTSLGSSSTLSPTSTWPWSAVTTSTVVPAAAGRAAGHQLVDPVELLVVVRRRGRTRGTPCRGLRSRRTRTARRPWRAGSPRRPACRACGSR